MPPTAKASLRLSLLVLLVALGIGIAHHQAEAVHASPNVVACNYVGDPNCAPGQTPMGPSMPSGNGGCCGSSMPSGNNSGCCGSSAGSNLQPGTVCLSAVLCGAAPSGQGCPFGEIFVGGICSGGSALPLTSTSSSPCGGYTLNLISASPCGSSLGSSASGCTPPLVSLSSLGIPGQGCVTPQSSNTGGGCLNAVTTGCTQGSSAGVNNVPAMNPLGSSSSGNSANSGAAGPSAGSSASAGQTSAATGVPCLGWPGVTATDPTSCPPPPTANSTGGSGASGSESSASAGTSGSNAPAGSCPATAPDSIQQGYMSNLQAGDGYCNLINAGTGSGSGGASSPPATASSSGGSGASSTGSGSTDASAGNPNGAASASSGGTSSTTPGSPPCGSLVGYLAGSDDQPVKFDGLIGDASLQASQSSCPAPASSGGPSGSSSASAGASGCNGNGGGQNAPASPGNSLLRQIADAAFDGTQPSPVGPTLCTAATSGATNANSSASGGPAGCNGGGQNAPASPGTSLLRRIADTAVDGSSGPKLPPFITPIAPGECPGPAAASALDAPGLSQLSGGALPSDATASLAQAASTADNLQNVFNPLTPAKQAVFSISGVLDNLLSSPGNHPNLKANSDQISNLLVQALGAASNAQTVNEDGPGDADAGPAAQALKSAIALIASSVGMDAQAGAAPTTPGSSGH